MAYYNDYILRQIEDMAQVIGKAFFHKKTDAILEFDAQGNVLASGLLYRRMTDLVGQQRIGRAEDLLFETLAEHTAAEYFEVALQFYADLQRLSDETLLRGGFSRQEITDGLAEIQAMLNEQQ